MRAWLVFVVLYCTLSVVTTRHLRTAVKELKDQMKMLEKRLRATQEPEDFVAFIVKLDRDQTLTWDGQTLQFDHHVLDTHGAFDMNTGEFIAPVAGNYLFSLTALSQSGKEARLKVMKYDTLLAQCFTGKDASWSSGSVTVVAELEINDRVSVNNWGNHDSDVFGEDFTSFMGVRIS